MIGQTPFFLLGYRIYMAMNSGTRAHLHGHRARENPDDCRRKVTIKGVPSSITDDEISRHAKQFGTIEGRIMRNRTVNGTWNCYFF